MESLDLVFHALADGTRRSMLLRLAKVKDATVSELSEPYAISLAAASKHLQVLERAGLVLKSRERRIVRCRLSLEPLDEASNVLERYREFWRKRLDGLERFLDEGAPPGRHGRKRR
ncbi:MAG TPA: metalloregulator ArsR/SmtB family transcription factor [Vicinamibacteria bacterium]|jgi:DNA-binding transcriptional ArsR family regulator